MTIEELWTIHKSDPRLPFNIEDASRRCENQQEEDVHEETEDKNVKGKKKDIIVSQHTRLDHRIIDLRVPANKAMMKVQAAVSHLFREFCMG
jgi:nondiscriminating aspartyl-tRNA synthetase